MIDFPRREIGEIIEIAGRETNIVSVFVEGNFDRDLLEKYLRVKGRDKTISVYPIDSIEVPNNLLEKASLNLGSNKSRVIALSIEVSKAGEGLSQRAICIADADCDRELGLLKSNPALRYTDYTSMEMYGFEPSILSEVCKFSLNISEEKIKELEQLMQAVLPTLFALRCCNEELKLDASMPAITSGFEKKKGNKAQNFDVGKYVLLFITQNKLTTQKQKISDLFDARYKKLSADIRHKAHGHDAVKLFYLFLNREKVLVLSDQEIDLIGNRIFLGSADLGKLDAFSLFQGLFPLIDAAKEIS